MLGNLDVQLDEELARYRRQNGRRGGQTNLNRQNPLPQVPLTPLPVVDETVAALPTAKTGKLSTAASTEPDVTSSPTSSYSQAVHTTPDLSIAGLPLAIASEPNSPSTAPYALPPKVAMLNVHPQTDDRMVDSTASSADLVADSRDAWEPDDYLESSEHLLQSLADEEVELRTSQEPGMLQSLLTPLGIGSMLLLLLSSVTFGYLLMNPSSMSFLSLGANQQTSAPNLATGSDSAGTSGVPNAAVTGQEVSPNLSAQEFPEVNLDTLSTLPKTTAIAPSNAPLTDASALGTGSSVATTPAASPGLNSRPDPSGSQSVSRASASTNSATSSSRTSQATASTASPSSRARTVDTPSQQTRPRRAAAPARTATSSSRPPAANATNGRTSSPAPSPQRVATQPSQPRSQAPAPTVATAPRVPAVVTPAPSRSTPDSTASPSAALTYYYVVMDFSGDRSLEQARQVVGDAFLRNFSDGAKIQFGRFADRERASALARDLQSQGISARVYQP